MKEFAIAVLGSGLLSGVLATIISLVVAGVHEKQKQGHGISAGVQILLYDRIKDLCKMHLEDGFVSVEDLEDLERMHRIYHDDLKGNGFLLTLMEKVKALPNERMDV